MMSVVSAFHVFVEGAKDVSPQALQRLAQAMAAHYGIPAADLAKRLAAGRFRVKANVDRATADQYARDLDRLGARCAIVPSDGTATPPAGVPAVPAVRPSQPQYQSGLAAAFTPPTGTPTASLGALENVDGALALASVDGSDSAGAPAAEVAFAPPGGGGLPASIGPAPEKPKAKAPAAAAAKAGRPKDEPLDLFVPPESAHDDLKVDLADDELERSARKRASTPPASMPVVSAPDPAPAVARAMTPPARRSQPIPAQTPSATVAVERRGGLLADGRVRFAAGVLLAIVLGFVPAHLVAAMREKSSYDEIDRNVTAASQQVSSMEEYAALDQLRAEQLDHKKSSRRTIAIMAFVIWGAAGAGVAYVWFRRIPWDRVAA